MARLRENEAHTGGRESTREGRTSAGRAGEAEGTAPSAVARGPTPFEGGRRYRTTALRGQTLDRPRRRADSAERGEARHRGRKRVAWRAPHAVRRRDGENGAEGPTSKATTARRARERNRGVFGRSSIRLEGAATAAVHGGRKREKRREQRGAAQRKRHRTDGRARVRACVERRSEAARATGRRTSRERPRRRTGTCPGARDARRGDSSASGAPTPPHASRRET